MRRRDLPAFFFVLLAGRAARSSRLEKAARYLWGRQGAEGGWHSTTYGLLKSGQSLTPFVLEALCRLPDRVYVPPRDSARRAVAFIERHTDAEGAMGRMDRLLEDYPNYATSLAALALSRAPAALQRPSLLEKLAGCLRRQQFSEEQGWKPNDPAYGAWGMGGERRTPPHPGHVDLSMTRHALQALAAAGASAGDPLFRRARVFVERCQNPDGGFYFSTVVLDANKAGRDGERFQSYGTATADGILSLLAMGSSPQDSRVQAAAGWLTRHHRAGEAPGFRGEAYRRWSQGLRFYYAAASADAFRALRIDKIQEGASDLEHSQRPDGSWANAESLVKEDDPLIATAFALRALT